MDYKELAEKAKEIDEKATPGPWMWDLRECNHQCLLTTTHSGKYYVMGFQRWGLQDALPSFQVCDRYDGPMKDRGSHGMVRADKLSKSYPGQEHHRGFDNFIDHPDARYIAESRQLFHLLAEAITDLLARADAAETANTQLDGTVSTLMENNKKLSDALKEAEVRAEKAEMAIADLTGIAPRERITTCFGHPLDRVRELVEADREGRCVVLPCKIGDTVYQVDCMTHGEALRAGVPEKADPRSKRKFGRKKAEYLPLMVREKKMVKTLYSEFEKTVFMTRAEAEAALKAREQDGNTE